jgi:hypothetical protein
VLHRSRDKRVLIARRHKIGRLRACLGDFRCIANNTEQIPPFIAIVINRQTMHDDVLFGRANNGKATRGRMSPKSFATGEDYKENSDLYKKIDYGLALRFLLG